MTRLETLGYALLYGYLAFGVGYLIKYGLTAVNFVTPQETPIPIIGIHERITINIDYIFEENGITQIDPIHTDQ